MKKSIDFLIPVAERGGVENVISRNAPYLMEHGWAVRIVQIVYEGFDWTPKDVHFFTLLEGREGHNLNEMVEAYLDFCNREGFPSIVLATGWPYMCYLAKTVAFMANKDMIVISWLHNMLEKYEQSGWGGLDALNIADFHFAISDIIKSQILVNGPIKPIYRVNNPVIEDNLPMLYSPSKPGERKRLLYIGRLDQPKRPDIILKAIAEVYPKWELHIVGSGEKEFEKDLKQLIKALRIYDVVKLYGWSNDPWHEVDRADAFIMASDFEGFPVAAIEAATCGLPVISTPVSGVTELIKPGENGYLFPHNDENALAEILTAIYEGKLPEIDPDNCRECAKPYWSANALYDFNAKLTEILESWSKQ